MQSDGIIRPSGPYFPGGNPSFPQAWMSSTSNFTSKHLGVYDDSNRLYFEIEHEENQFLYRPNPTRFVLPFTGIYLATYEEYEERRIYFMRNGTHVWIGVLDVDLNLMATRLYFLGDLNPIETLFPLDFIVAPYSLPSDQEVGFIVQSRTGNETYLVQYYQVAFQNNPTTKTLHLETLSDSWLGAFAVGMWGEEEASILVSTISNSREQMRFRIHSNVPDGASVPPEGPSTFIEGNGYDPFVYLSTQRVGLASYLETHPPDSPAQMVFAGVIAGVIGLMAIVVGVSVIVI